MILGLRNEPYMVLGCSPTIKSLNEVSARRQTEVFREALIGVRREASFSWTVEMLEHQIQADKGLFIEIEEKVCGFVLWRDLGDEAEVLCLATTLECRRAGWMERLLRGLFDANRQISSWWMEVHPLNVGALNLYTKLGFQKTGERKTYYPDGASALILLKTITP